MAKKVVDLSVVVVCHNCFDLTVKCIDAIRNSTVGVNEIVVVDNGSTDRTPQWGANQSDIFYISNQINLGCAIARNQGAKWSKSRNLLFLDNDQFVAPNTIEKMIKKGRIVGVENWEVFNERGETRRRKGALLSNHSYVGAGGLMIEKSLFLRLGGFDERYAPAWYEDVDFSFRLKKAGYGWNILEDSGIEHIGGGTSTIQSTYNFSSAKQKSMSLFRSIWLDEIKKPVMFKSKPLIYICVDVKGWAWDYKANQIKHYLSDEFDIEIVYTGGNDSVFANKDKKALWFFFECFQYEKIKSVRYVVGATAHTFRNMANYEKYFKTAVAVHANSLLLFEEVKSMNGKAYYLPNGVDHNLFKFQERSVDTTFTVGFVGKPNPRKGFNDFIKPACQEAGVELKAQICKYNSDNKLSQIEMSKFYSEVDCVMIASDMDGTPNMLLEAAAVGRTFIGNKIGNVPEFYNGRNGILLKNRSIGLYVNAIKDLKADRKTCTEMGIVARKSVEEKWSWEKQSENYRRMFREIV